MTDKLKQLSAEALRLSEQLHEVQLEIEAELVRLDVESSEPETLSAPVHVQVSERPEVWGYLVDG